METPLLGAAAGGFFSLIAGTVSGYLIQTDKWERIPFFVSINFKSVLAQKLSFSQDPFVSLKFSLSGKRRRSYTGVG